MNTNTYIEEKNSKELCVKIIYKFNHYYYRPRRPGTGIKYSSEEMGHEFQFRIFRPKKQDYLFKCSVNPPRNFPLERPTKSCSTQGDVKRHDS